MVKYLVTLSGLLMGYGAVDINQNAEPGGCSFLVALASINRVTRRACRGKVFHVTLVSLLNPQLSDMHEDAFTPFKSESNSNSKSKSKSNSNSNSKSKSKSITILGCSSCAILARGYNVMVYVLLEFVVSYK
jgi:hypothetical protein